MKNAFLELKKDWLVNGKTKTLYLAEDWNGWQVAFAVNQKTRQVGISFVDEDFYCEYSTWLDCLTQQYYKDFEQEMRGYLVRNMQPIHDYYEYLY